MVTCTRDIQGPYLKDMLERATSISGKKLKKTKPKKTKKVGSTN